jgi:hypothetical protein
MATPNAIMIHDPVCWMICSKMTQSEDVRTPGEVILSVAHEYNLSLEREKI